MSAALPILTFHSIDSTGSPVSVSRDQLRELLQDISSTGVIGCGLSEALAAADGPPRMALCFDDGYRNIADGALAVLEEFGFRATVFAITDYVGASGEWPGQPRELPDAGLLDWEGLGRLVEAGWEVGAHGVSHRPLTHLDDAELEAEYEGAREAIQMRLGIVPRTFAYPYGDCDDRVVEACVRCYEAAVGTHLAVATDADLRDRFRLPRVDAYYVRDRPWLMGSRRSALRAWLAMRRPPRAIRQMVAPDAPPQA
jgi:peptidoglycan/xylan/chitin deacetylase (PgdA/CDA1 family)